MIMNSPLGLPWTLTNGVQQIASGLEQPGGNPLAVNAGGQGRSREELKLKKPVQVSACSGLVSYADGET
jgi:hypothetical protein